MISKRTLVATVAVGLTAACQNANLTRAIEGPQVDLQPERTAGYRALAFDVLDELAVLAGADDVAARSYHKDVTKAGLLVIDAACGEYLEALFWLDRGKTHTVAQLGLVNTAASGALGLFGGGADLIAAVGGAFGLTTATVENIGESLLYQLEPSTVRELVRKTQIAFRQSFRTQIVDDRVAALEHMAAYAALCKPPAIESEVLRSVETAQAETETVALDSPPAVRLNGNEVSFQGITDERDSLISDALRAFYLADPANVGTSLAASATAEGVVTQNTSGPPQIYELLTRGDLKAFRASALEHLVDTP